MKVSIVIPNYNGSYLLQNNLPLVLKAAPEAELIVVDDASTDNSVELLKTQFSQVKIVQHPMNRRFAAACNSGIEAANGDIVVLLNSDVIPTAGFLEPLLRHFRDRTVFAVGCAEIEGQDRVVSGRTEWWFQRGFIVHHKPEDQDATETAWTFGGSMAVDRKKYLELGGMDELFAPAYWEDVDLCWRANQRGWKSIFEKDSVVYHQHETTNKTVFGNRNLMKMSFRNQILFVWKHIRGWQLIEHLLWLPYHLIFTSLRSKGVFFQAFLEAIGRWFSYSR